jgi:hypothetical protein
MDLYNCCVGNGLQEGKCEKIHETEGRERSQGREKVMMLS